MKRVIYLIDYNGLGWFYDKCKGDFQPTTRKDLAMRFENYESAKKVADELINSALGDIFISYKILGAE